MRKMLLSIQRFYGDNPVVGREVGPLPDDAIVHGHHLVPDPESKCGGMALAVLYSVPCDEVPQ